MSEEICYRDQDRLDYIFEQVKGLSDVVDELRIEVNDLKKASLCTKHEDILFECTKVNCEIDHVRPCVVDNVKTYFRNIRNLTATEKVHQLAENNQVSKSDSTFPSYMVQSKRERDEKLPSYKSPPAKITLSTIYDGLKSFKNKLVKIIHSVPAPQLFLKGTKDNCVESSGQQIHFSRKEEKRKFTEFDNANENDVSKCINVNEEPDDLTDTSFISDTSAQADVTICSCQEDDKKPTHSSCRDVTENNTQTSPLSLMSNNRFIVHSNRVTDESSKGRVKRAFLKNTSQKYKICSCGSQCPYALYKLPCCDQNNILEKKADNEISGLMLECSNFEQKNNFPKFVNIKAGREERLVDFEADESSTSSLSVDLEVDVCDNHGKLENIVDEFPEQRTMTHVTRETSARRNDNAISHFRAKNKSPMCVNLEANQQRYRTKIKDFIHDYRLIKSSDKRVQCSSATLRAVRRAPTRTSTLDEDFRRSRGSASRSCRATDTTKRMNFFRVMTPRRMKMNMHTQTERRSYFDRLQSIDLPIALGLGDERDTENIDEDGNKKISRKRNICRICDLPKQKAWPRTDKDNTQFALRTEKDSETNSSKPWNQMGYFNYRRDGMALPRMSCPYHCDRVLAERYENLATLMSHFAEYHSQDVGF